MAPELIAEALHQPLPAIDEVELRDAKLNQLIPTEYRTDLVMLLRGGELVFGIVVEVQLSIDVATFGVRFKSGLTTGSVSIPAAQFASTKPASE